MEVGQVLETISAQQQVLNNRTNTSTNYNSHIINDNNLRDSASNLKSEINNIWNYYIKKIDKNLFYEWY